jgi:hypothetical protein
MEQAETVILEVHLGAYSQLTLIKNISFRHALTLGFLATSTLPN